MCSNFMKVKYVSQWLHEASRALLIFCLILALNFFAGKQTKEAELDEEGKEDGEACDTQCMMTEITSNNRGMGSIMAEMNADENDFIATLGKRNTF